MPSSTRTVATYDRTLRLSRSLYRSRRSTTLPRRIDHRPELKAFAGPLLRANVKRTRHEAEGETDETNGLDGERARPRINSADVRGDSAVVLRKDFAVLQHDEGGDLREHLRIVARVRGGRHTKTL